MYVSFKPDDLRVRKTNTALINSMHTLLCTQNFSKISIYELCAEALVSRATFYAHFSDKYELLKCLLSGVLKNIPDDFSIYNEPDMISSVNEFVLTHKKVIKNILEDANDTTMELLQEFVILFINRSYGQEIEIPVDANCTVLLKFCTGGIINLLKWQIKNKFPIDNQFMNEDLCNVLKCVFKHTVPFLDSEEP